MTVGAKLTVFVGATLVLFCAIFFLVGVIVFDGSDQSGRDALGLWLLIIVPVGAVWGWMATPWLAK